MTHYLMILGESVHAIRAGSGSPAQAAHDAFGIRRTDELARTLFKEVPLATMRSDTLRTRACLDLLQHVKCEDERNELERLEQIRAIGSLWHVEWERYERRYKRSALTGGQPFKGPIKKSPRLTVESTSN